jgi:hypothetical protein
MILRRDKNGILQIVWRGKELKARRMWIRCRIPMNIMSREMRTLIDLCVAKDAERWEDFECYMMDFEGDWLEQIKRYAVDIGIKHWYLRGTEGYDPKATRR